MKATSYLFDSIVLLAILLGHCASMDGLMEETRNLNIEGQHGIARESLGGGGDSATQTAVDSDQIQGLGEGTAPEVQVQNINPILNPDIISVVKQSMPPKDLGKCRRTRAKP